MTRDRSPRESTVPSPTKELDFTIIVPTYRRPLPLRRCLAALTKLAYDPERFEVLVVDDGSRPPVSELLPPDAERPRNFRILRQANSGPALARNFGAAAARGRWLAFTDDDCAPRPEWLDRLRRVLLRRPEALVGGRCVNALPDNPWSKASQQLLDHLYESFNVDPENARFFASMNFAADAELFRKIGGFDESFWLAAEDRDFCDRWRGGVGPLIYAEEAVVDHLHEMGFRGFWRQHRNYGRSTPHYHRIRRRRSGTLEDGPLPEPLRFYFDLLRRPLSGRPGRPAAWLEAGRLAVAQLAYLSGYLTGGMRRARRRTQGSSGSLEHGPQRKH